MTNKLAFHLPHVTILGKNHCRKTRRKDFQRRQMFMNAKSICDYNEPIYFHFFNRNQSEYYGINIFLSKKGISLDHVKCKGNNSYNISGEYIINLCNYSFIYDNIDQYCVTTYVHTKIRIEYISD